MAAQSSTDFFLPADLVARAIEELMQQCHDHIDRLSRQSKQGDPDVKTETKFWLSQYRAFTKALHYWQQGIRPTVSSSGSWLLPSASRPGAVIHECSKHGGVWACGPTCKAGARGIFHWHSALVQGIEQAMELADSTDDGEAEPYDAYEAYEPEQDIDPEPFPMDAPAQLGRRLAMMRAERIAREFNSEVFAV